ncbi:kinesin-like protein KIF2C isoform X2 [Corythoichthys intestinalis]|uniref:kinesin-like protein KIF2C isoform X2 n=1 Tax=Corythoichthys intestinalis TaxID=161448 RepID=UPI0025A5CD1D|nr:kinesin-like protein KIF2C isoform X2 [Corythoichthys intestinalis]
MESKLIKHLVGLNVQISRSDGRVHGATVKFVDALKPSATVEWADGDCHRMKEVELDDMFTFNPELLDHLRSIVKSAEQSQPPPTEKTYNGRLRSSRVPGKPSTQSQSKDNTKETDWQVGTMESKLTKHLVGLNVQISRSNGRVHGATVKFVDALKPTVTVEWAEGDAHQMKEVELDDVFKLNPEVLEHIQSKSAEQSQPPSTVKMYIGRLRSSRIPGPPSIVTRSKDRLTTRLQSQPSIDEPCELPTSTSLTNHGTLNEPRKKTDKPASSVPFVLDTVKENYEPVEMAARGKRKTLMHQDLVKASKRLSSVDKLSEVQKQKGKLKECARPNQKFYEMIQDYRETLESLPISVSDVIESHRICVCVRKRPLNKKELTRKEIDVISVPGRGTVVVHEPKQKVDLTKYLENKTFQFDHCFDEESTNELVYRFTAKPLVQSIFEGGMATCFAYGQTGSGKTHTMGGDFTGKQQNCARGIYALAAQDVFSYLNHWRYNDLNLSAYVSFFEIYNGKVYDLLNKKAMLRVLEDEHQQVQVVGLQEVCVATADMVIKMIQQGTACRTFGQTSANANSSRSHAILQIVLRRNDRNNTLHGKFSLVDLAGNERGTDVYSNDRATLVETAEINRSLLTLKECIRSLGMNSDHIPFRMSTLTKVLRDSFIGENSKTCMIAMVSPGMASCEYTMNTLRYADRVKELKEVSKATGGPITLQPANSSSEEDTTVYDAISHVADVEEKVYGELQEIVQRASNLVKSMEQTTYDSEAGLAHLMDFNQFLKSSRFPEVLQALQSAISGEKRAKMNR